MWKLMINKWIRLLAVSAVAVFGITVLFAPGCKDKSQDARTEEAAVNATPRSAEEKAAPTQSFKPPPLVETPLTEGEIAFIEDHDEELLRWGRLGYKGLTVLHVDAHDDYRKISDDVIEKADYAVKGRDWDGLWSLRTIPEEDGFHVGNYLYVAAKTGIVKKIYWIIPFRHFLEPDVTERIRNVLRYRKFPEEDIRDFAVNDDGCVAGSLYGTEFAVCGPDKMPTIREPVVLSVDLDFIPAAAFEFQTNKLAIVRTLTLAIKEKKYDIKSASIAYSINGEFLPVEYRYLGKIVSEAIKNPGLLNRPNPPSHWSVWWESESWIRNRQYEGALDFLDSMEQRSPGHEALPVWRSLALIGLSRYDEAYDIAERICTEDKGYCYLFHKLGRRVLESGKLDKAGRFFEAGISKDPSMRMFNDLTLYADALYNNKKYDDALRISELLLKIDGSFPAGFISGAVYMKKGDEESALKQFEKVREHLSSYAGKVVKTDDLRRMVLDAIDLYERKGLSKEASAIRTGLKISEGRNK